LTLVKASQSQLRKNIACEKVGNLRWFQAQDSADGQKNGVRKMKTADKNKSLTRFKSDLLRAKTKA
jgi:hypothetical protein